MISSRIALTCFALLVSSSAAHAASITLEGLTTPIAVNAKIKKVPEQIASGVGNAVASGLVWTGGEGFNAGMESKFIAWCFDLIHPVSLGATYEYEVVDAPYSSSYLLDGADLRVSSLFNATYDILEASDAVQAAAFQLAVWEVANDDDFDLGGGVFQASGHGQAASEITSTAQKFLAAGAIYSGPVNWQTTFLETREARGTQNLVTAVAVPEATPVPVPASGFLLVAGLTGLAFLRRRQLPQA